jgi:hypothetical protein
VRRLAIAFSSALVLALGLAATALAWQQPQLATDCMPDDEHYAWWITLPGQESNYNFDWSFNSNFSGATTVDAGGTAPFYFTTPLPDTDPPHTLYVRWSSDHNAKTSTAANTESCDEPDIDIDKWPSDGEGGLIDAPVEPGTTVTFIFEIHNTGNTNLSIVEVEDHLDGTDVPNCTPAFDEDRTADFGEADDDDAFEPEETWVYSCEVEVEETQVDEACVYANVDHPEANDVTPESDVFDCAKATVTVTEGGEGGGTGTPPQGGSIPNTATSQVAPSSPVLTLLFGVLLVSALGGLAFVNVRSGRR